MKGGRIEFIDTIKLIYMNFSCLFMLELSRVIPIAVYEANGVIEGIEEFREVVRDNIFDEQKKKGFCDWTPLRSDRISITYLSEIELFIPSVAEREGKYQKELVRLSLLKGIIVIYNTSGYIDLIGSDINLTPMKRSILDHLSANAESELTPLQFSQRRIHKVLSIAEQITRIGYFLPITVEDKSLRIKRYESFSDSKKYLVVINQIRQREKENIFALGGGIKLNGKQISFYINFISGRLTLYNPPTDKLGWEDIFEVEDSILG